jgi:REP element-mobilizing transposase RayT
MARPLRYVPPNSLVEVTCRTVHGRFLLRPSRDLNEIVYGLIAKAARLYDVGVCSFKVLSNHYHLLLLPQDAKGLAAFMGYFNGNLAKEAGRLHNWRERFWGRRYHHSVVSDEPEAQVARLRYVLAQGCKEGLVRRPEDWPGANSVEAQLTGRSLRGLWFSRTAEFEARPRGERPGKYEYASEESLELKLIPCWSALSRNEIRSRTAKLARDIETETRLRLEQEGKSPMGRARILRQVPHEAPRSFLRSPAPRFHAATGAVRRTLERGYLEFLVAFRQAAEALKTGGTWKDFPLDCFPPSLPYRRPPPGPRRPSPA